MVLPYLRRQLILLGVEESDDEFLCKVIVAQRERVKTLKEMAANSRFLFDDRLIWDQQAVAKHLAGDGRSMLGAVRAALAALAEWSPEAINQALKLVASTAGTGLGKVAQPLRVAVTGTTISPPIDVTLALLGRAKTLARVDVALGFDFDRAKN